MKRAGYLGRIATFNALVMLCAFDSVGHAQASTSAQASGSADIELGATQPSAVEANAGSYGPAANTSHSSASSGSSGGVRLALQLRIDAINTLGFAQPGTGDVGGAGFATLGRELLVPIAAPGVRILDNALFLGLGFGFVGASSENDAGGEQSRSGFSLTPIATYDLLSDDTAAFSLVGGLNLASLGETETCAPNGMCMESNDDGFGWGVLLGAGLRGILSPGLAIGGEFGWGFLSVGYDNGSDTFVHTVFGNLLFEASLGL